MYRGISGKQYQLDAKPFNSGGEGDIYDVLNEKDLVAKIYHSGLASKESEDKLTYMVNKPPDPSVLSQVAWPADVIYDSRNQFKGFIMPKLSITTELLELYKYPPRKYKNITFSQKLLIAQNICVVISAVHKAGYVFGDFNPRNIGIDINTGRVAFLDTDSYHVVLDKESNKAFRCKVCLDGYAAPELLFKIEKEGLEKEAYALAALDTFTKKTDEFALAIHIFKLLMNGYTPFNGIQERDRPSQASPGLGSTAIKRNNYCFKPGLKPQAPAVPPVDALPKHVADLFARAFLHGHKTPKVRPTALEWYEALGRYEDLLVKCDKNSAHEYHEALSSCPWCEADERFLKANAVPVTQRRFTHPPVVVPPPQRAVQRPNPAPKLPLVQSLGGGASSGLPKLPYSGRPKSAPRAPEIGWKVIPLVLGSAFLYHVFYRSLQSADRSTAICFIIATLLALVVMSLVKVEYEVRLLLGGITLPIVAIIYDLLTGELSGSFWQWFATVVVSPLVFSLMLALPCYIIMKIQDANQSP